MMEIKMTVGVTASATAFTAIDVSRLPTKKLEAGTAEAFLKPPEPPPPEQVKADNDPSNLYATIQKDGKTIASFYKSGLMVTPNSVSLPDDLAVDGHGQSLAEVRMQQMLDLHGGKVDYASDMRSANAATLFAAQLLS